jgi:miniconductance mechanosensitive channel
MFLRFEDIIREWLSRYGLSGNFIMFFLKLIEIGAVILLAVIAYHIVKIIVVYIIHSVAKRTKTKWDDYLVRNHFFGRLSYFVPAYIFYLLLPMIFHDNPVAQKVTMLLVKMYGLVVLVWVINSFLKTAEDIYQTYEMSKIRSIRGYIQIVKIIVYTIAGILFIALLVNRSPLTLLAGLGAASAVLLLIFRDSILGFVGGIQLAANDMLRTGDWITMAKYGADGTVIDVTLTTVKVKNFDNTITTIPTYSLVSDAFQNWRGMEDSGVRRIKRAINVDMTTIRFCSPDMLKRFSRNPYLQEFIETNRSAIDKHHTLLDGDPVDRVQEFTLTNLNLFIVYMKEYLMHNEDISHDHTLMVRHLHPTDTGLPVEIYAFSKIQEWKSYEDVQAEIVNHLLAAIYYFDLKVFQSPAGTDIRERKTGR